MGFTEVLTIVFIVLKLFKSKFVKDEQFKNILDIVVTFAVLKLLKSKLVKDGQ